MMKSVEKGCADNNKFNESFVVTQSTVYVKPAYQNLNGTYMPKGPMNPPPRLLICHMICCIMRC